LTLETEHPTLPAELVGNQNSFLVAPQKVVVAGARNR
jgi:hypothetical protein